MTVRAKSHSSDVSNQYRKNSSLVRQHIKLLLNVRTFGGAGNRARDRRMMDDRPASANSTSPHLISVPLRYGVNKIQINLVIPI